MTITSQCVSSKKKQHWPGYKTGCQQCHVMSDTMPRIMHRGAFIYCVFPSTWHAGLSYYYTQHARLRPPYASVFVSSSFGSC